MKNHLLGLSLISTAMLLSSCNSTAMKTCESIRDDIVELSEKDRASRGYAIVKIYEPVEVSRSNEKLSCEGRASWSDQDETKLKYSTYKDSEGEWMLEYEPVQ